MERCIATAKEATEHASSLCSRVAQGILSKTPINKLAPLLQEAKVGIDIATVRTRVHECVLLAECECDTGAEAAYGYGTDVRLNACCE